MRLCKIYREISRGRSRLIASPAAIRQSQLTTISLCPFSAFVDSTSLSLIYAYYTTFFPNFEKNGLQTQRERGRRKSKQKWSEDSSHTATADRYQVQVVAEITSATQWRCSSKCCYWDHEDVTSKTILWKLQPVQHQSYDWYDLLCYRSCKHITRCMTSCEVAWLAACSAIQLESAVISHNHARPSVTGRTTTNTRRSQQKVLEHAQRPVCDWFWSWVCPRLPQLVAKFFWALNDLANRQVVHSSN